MTEDELDQLGPWEWDDPWYEPPTPPLSRQEQTQLFYEHLYPGLDMGEYLDHWRFPNRQVVTVPPSGEYL